MSKGIDPTFAAETAKHEDYGGDWVSGSAEALRTAYDAARSGLAGDVAPGCRIEPFAVAGGVEGLLFRPDGGDRDDAVVYFHGGSWVVGSPETHRVPCSHLAVVAGVPVYSIRYRLAPENPFPAQREDGVRAVETLLAAGAGGLPAPRRIVIAGDSAGAAVTFWTEAALSEAARARVAGVVGFYGGYGILPADDRTEPDTGDGLSSEALLAAYRRLGPLDRLKTIPGFTIVESVPADGPPCYLTCGTVDPLLSNSRAFAERLERIGRPVTLDLAEGLGHSFLHYAARVPAAGQALDRAARWIVGRLPA